MHASASASPSAKFQMLCATHLQLVLAVQEDKEARKEGERWKSRGDM